MSDFGSTRMFEVMNSSWPAGFVSQERSVWFGCICDVFGIIDDVAVVDDEGQSSTSPRITNPGTSCLIRKFLATSSVLDDALCMVDVTREDYEAK